MKIVYPLLVFISVLFGQTGQRTEKYNALSFEAESTFCEVPYHAELNPKDDFTVELWVRHSHWGQHTLSSVLFSRSEFAGYSVFANANRGNWVASIGNGNNWIIIQGPKIIPGVWTHLALTYSKSVFRLYVNGIHSGSINGSFVPNIAGALRFGLNADGTHSQWYGSVGEFRLWKRERSNDEILSSMFELRVPRDSSLVAWMKFNESSCRTVKDHTGNGHDGSIFGAVRQFSDRPKGSSILWVRNDNILFPNIAAGSSQTAEIVLENRGTSDLEITSLESDDPDFSLSLQRCIIPPITTRSVTVTFTPRSPGKKIGTVTVRHKGLGGEQVIRLIGSCAVPEITSIVPSSTASGATLRIHGRFLSGEDSPSSVFIGSLHANIVSSSPDQLTVIVPVGLIHDHRRPLFVQSGGLTVTPRLPFKTASSVEGRITPGSFVQAAPFRTGQTVTKIIAADLNNDGTPEVITLHPSDPVAVIRSASTLAEKGFLTVQGNAEEILAADLDGDGNSDLAVSYPASGEIVLYRNVSTADEFRFIRSAVLPMQSGGGGLITEDIDDDGMIDILAAGRNDWSIVLLRNESTSGTYKFEVISYGMWAKPTFLVSGHFDDDAHPDLAVTNGIDNLLNIYRTDYDIQPQELIPQEKHTASQMPGKIVTGDIDGDGKTDLALLDFSGSIYLYRNISVGSKVSFTDRSIIPVGSMQSDIGIADMTGDGKPDLVTLSAFERNVTVFENRSVVGEITPLSFGQGVSYAVGDSLNTLLIADLTMDGRPDIIAAGGGVISMLKNSVTHQIDWMVILFVGLGFVMAAGGAGWYITNARLKKKVRTLEHEQAIERERSRIARDLHDELGARLTEISYMTDAARKSASTNGKAEEHLEEIGSTARNIVDSFREIVWAVNPQQDSLDSLVDFLEQYAIRFLGTVNIRCFPDVPGSIPAMALTSDARHSIFMAVKEALNNIAKHAGATEVHFAVLHSENSITLSLHDNGKGFTMDSVGRFGNGLTTMKERLEVVNGNVTMTSTPGNGTSVDFTIPLHY
ncbi:MAG: FG-GAP-like repeat-containing protein [Bacteroidota bacterium]